MLIPLTRRSHCGRYLVKSTLTSALVDWVRFGIPGPFGWAGRSRDDGPH